MPVNLTDHYPTMYMIDNLTIIKNCTKNVPLHRSRKSFHSQILCEELDKKFGELVSNNLPLNRAIINFVFDKFVAQMTKTIDRQCIFKTFTV